MVQIKNPVTIVNQGGGGGVSRPTTWAEFKAMTATDMQKVYGVGDRVGLPCLFKDTAGKDLTWEIGAFGTTKIENDNTEYPCVTLIARLIPDVAIQYDANEAALATEETAQDGVYYFGYNGSTYSALNLTTGDPIPYSSYNNVYKTDLTNNLTFFNDFRQSGYANYHYSEIRQWLNSNSAADAWWSATHIGDTKPAIATTEPGFMNGLPSDFKAILSRTEIITYGRDPVGIQTYTDYDYFFLPSRYEMYVTDTPVEGDRIPYFAINNTNKRGLNVRGSVSGSNTINIWSRSSDTSWPPIFTYTIADRGSASDTKRPGSGNYYALPACKIILAGA